MHCVALLLGTHGSNNAIYFGGDRSARGAKKDEAPKTARLEARDCCYYYVKYMCKCSHTIPCKFVLIMK